jgi:hypothetical protein
MIDEQNTHGSYLPPNGALARDALQHLSRCDGQRESKAQPVSGQWRLVR